VYIYIYKSPQAATTGRSVSGQLEVVNGGAPFVYFDLGDGKCATCNPISEPDLAAALVDTIADKAKENALWNLGTPRRVPYLSLHVAI